MVLNTLRLIEIFWKIILCIVNNNIGNDKKFQTLLIIIFKLKENIKICLIINHCFTCEYSIISYKFKLYTFIQIHNYFFIIFVRTILGEPFVTFSNQISKP